MSEPFVLASESEAMPRCCARHPDWSTLSEHLLVDFPSVAIGDVVREVRAAKVAATSVRLPDDEALEIAELIARQQLMLLSGDRQDIARLDPETHSRGKTATTASTTR